jgi:hypothetical protein
MYRKMGLTVHKHKDLGPMTPWRRYIRESDRAAGADPLETEVKLATRDLDADDRINELMEETERQRDIHMMMARLEKGFQSLRLNCICCGKARGEGNQIETSKREAGEVGRKDQAVVDGVTLSKTPGMSVKG